MSVRYFCCTPSVYEEFGLALDAAYGYPNETTKTVRTLPDVAGLPKDNQGRVYVAILSVYCEYDLPQKVLPELLQSGSVIELTHQQYESVVPPPPAMP